MCLKGRKGSPLRTFPWLDNNWHLLQLRVGHQFLGEVLLILSTMYTATFLEEEVPPSHYLLLETNIFNIPKGGGGGRRARLGAEKPFKSKRHDRQLANVMA